MHYMLIHRRGPVGHHTFRVNHFPSVGEAINEARRRCFAGEDGDFVLEDSGTILMNDQDIAEVCKSTLH